MGTELAPASEMELEPSSVFSASSNPLLQNTQSQETLQMGLSTDKEGPRLDGESINIVPIPNAKGDISGEYIPNALEGGFDSVNLPFNEENQDIQLGEGVTIKGENSMEGSANVEVINGM